MKGLVALYGFGGGSGGSGAALTVKAPAGVTVTVSKDGKSKNKTANSSGIAVFKGLSTGEWTVTITDGEKTASKPVTIIADFNKTITFFSATIHVTYPAGSTCTATDGVTIIHAPDTSGTWDCVVPNAGTWTITASGYIPKSVSVSTSGTTVSVDLTKIYLFKAGNQYTDVTGGWKNAVVNAGSYGNSGKATIGDVINVTATSGAQGASTVNKIDLTKYKSIIFKRTKKGGDSAAYSSLAVTSAASGDVDTIRVAASHSSPLDIASISGKYYIMVYAYHNRNDDFDNIYLST